MYLATAGPGEALAASSPVLPAALLYEASDPRSGLLALLRQGLWSALWAEPDRRQPSVAAAQLRTQFCEQASGPTACVSVSASLLLDLQCAFSANGGTARPL